MLIHRAIGCRTINLKSFYSYPLLHYRSLIVGFVEICNFSSAQTFRPINQSKVGKNYPYPSSSLCSMSDSISTTKNEFKHSSSTQYEALNTYLESSYSS